MAVAVENGGAAVPPQNEEAEVAVLGTVLMAEEALDKILVELTWTRTTSTARATS